MGSQQRADLLLDFAACAAAHEVIWTRETWDALLRAARRVCRRVNGRVTCPEDPRAAAVVVFALSRGGARLAGAARPGSDAAVWRALTPDYDTRGETRAWLRRVLDSDPPPPAL